MPARATTTTRFALLLALAFAGAVQAQDRRVLSAWIEPQDVFSRRAASLVYWQLLSHLASQPNTAVRDAAALLDPEAAADRLAPAREKLAAGTAAYENLELERAERELFGAVQAFEADPANLIGDAGRAHRTALAYLGAVWLLKGDADKAEDAFRRLLVIDPEHRLDETIFPPAMLQVFSRMVREVADGPRGALEITAQPDPALVFVDGRFLGLTPVRIERLPAGDHLVALRGPGLVPFGRQASVGAAEDTAVACRMKPLAQLAAWQREFPGDRLGGGEPLPRSIQERARRAGLDRLWLGRTARLGAEISLALVMYDVGSGRVLFERTGRLPADSADPTGAAARAVADLLPGADLVVDSGPSLPPPSGPTVLRLAGEERFEEAAQPWYRRWWFWTALGAGAAVTTILAILLAGSQDAARSQIVIEF